MLNENAEAFKISLNFNIIYRYKIYEVKFFIIDLSFQIIDGLFSLIHGLRVEFIKGNIKRGTIYIYIPIPATYRSYWTMLGKSTIA